MDKRAVGEKLDESADERDQEMLIDDVSDDALELTGGAKPPCDCITGARTTCGPNSLAKVPNLKR